MRTIKNNTNLGTIESSFNKPRELFTGHHEVLKLKADFFKKKKLRNDGDIHIEPKIR